MEETVNKTKHTPGPWVIGQSGDLDTPIFCNGKDAINVFAGETGQLQAEANARLIAAAPEMLEEVRRFREIAYQQNWYASITALDALLKKATGGSDV
jgi:hypothetical protein